jgi:hypothetical protein
MADDKRPLSDEERRAAMVEADRQRSAERARANRRSRLIWIGVIWILFVVPGLVFTWVLLGWLLGLLITAGIVWATWDYWRRGEMVAAMEGVHRAGVFFTGIFTRGDRDG